MNRRIDTPTTLPTSLEAQRRDAIGRARTLTPGELHVSTDGGIEEIQRMGFKLSDLATGRR